MIESGHIAKLKKILGKELVLTCEEDLTVYSYDATATWVHLPDVVVLPTTTEQISQVLKLANENKIPVTARGAGTNLSGGSVPVKGGIVLCTTKMREILEINKANLSAVVEPGVVLQDLSTALAEQGLFFPPDPQSFLGCTMGGVVAENAGGPRCVKYGVTKQYVLGLEVVLADGRIMKIGGLTSKNRTEYGLTTLFVGSEGTMGVITQMTLKLLPVPPARKTIMALYDDMAVAGEAVSTILARGMIPSKIEYLDNWFIRRIEELTPMGLPVEAKALLLLESDGIQAAVDVEAQQIIDICEKSGAREIKVAKDQDEADRLWKVRSGGFAAVYSAAHTVLLEDVAVPRDKMAQFIKGCEEISRKYDVVIPLIGHAGDGNLHPSILTDDRNEEHFARAKKAMDALFELALSLGGVISGEHGVGLEKQPFFQAAMDPAAIDIMKKMKVLLDPNDILNPGKIWQEEA